MNESNNLKEKILKEIAEINKQYETINNQITDCFKLKYENLQNKENDLKDLLKNETTKMKEKLEEYFSETNNVIKEGERLNKLIKKFEKEKEKNPIKNLTYISYINSKKTEMEQLFLNSMKNLKISYIDNEEYLKLEEYYFSGLKYPKDIEFKDIGSDKLQI